MLSGPPRFRDAVFDILDDPEHPTLTSARLRGIAQDLDVSTDTRFDRYVPWAAREFSRIYKQLKDLAKQSDRSWFATALSDEGVLASGWSNSLFSRDFRLWDRHRQLFPRGVASHIDATLQEARDFRDLFSAIVDWAEDERVDLNKYTWEEARVAAARYRSENVSQGAVVYRFPDGWTVQELSATELKSEGAAMGHCIASYGIPVQQGHVRIYSLRDPKGLPHATMEWMPSTAYVRELKGKLNRTPLLSYLARLVAFRRDYMGVASDVRPTPPSSAWLTKFNEKYLGSWTLSNWQGGDIVLALFERRGRVWAADAAEIDAVIETSKLAANDRCRSRQSDCVERQMGNIIAGTDIASAAPEEEIDAYAQWTIWLLSGVQWPGSTDQMLQAIAHYSLDPATVATQYPPVARARHQTSDAARANPCRPKPLKRTLMR